MNRSDTRPTLPNVIRRVAAGLALMLVAAACSQCRAVPDAVTGVDLRVNAGGGYGVCVRACTARYRQARRAEQRRFIRAARGCGGSPSCVMAERELHFSRRMQLLSALKECKRGCYNEGSGGGGR